MDNLVLVHIIQSSTNLLHNVPSQVLRNFSFLPEKVVELSRKAKLQNEVDVLRISEESVHLDDIGVIQESLDLDLTDKLNHQLTVHILLVYLLQRTHKTSSLVTN